MATFADELREKMKRRQEEAQRIAEGKPSQADIIALFTQSLQDDILPMIEEIENGEVPLSRALRITNIEDDYSYLSDSFLWKELVRRAAVCGYHLYKIRYIHELSEEELSLPENFGLGRIGGRPEGIDIKLRYLPEILDLEKAVHGKFPYQQEIMHDMRKEVDARDSLSSYGGSIRVFYNLGIPKNEKVKFTPSFLDCREICAELGLNLSIDSYKDILTITVSFNSMW